MSDNRLTHDERLRGEIRVNELFLSGESFIAYPYRIVYKTGDSARPVSSAILVSIPKKRFKRAVKRNKLRRRIKEAFRLNKSLLNIPLETAGKTIDMAIIYLDKEVQPYAFLEKRMKEMLQNWPVKSSLQRPTKKNNRKRSSLCYGSSRNFSPPFSYSLFIFTGPAFLLLNRPVAGMSRPARNMPSMPYVSTARDSACGWP